MYHENVYRQIGEEFGTGIGVATSIRVTEIGESPRVERSREERILYRRMNDQWRINRVIAEAVRRNRYPELTRRVFWLRTEHRDWTERRCYTTAWKTLTGKPLKQHEPV
jgi:hypothetical protein